MFSNKADYETIHSGMAADLVLLNDWLITNITDSFSVCENLIINRHAEVAEQTLIQSPASAITQPLNLSTTYMHPFPLPHALTHTRITAIFQP